MVLVSHAIQILGRDATEAFVFITCVCLLVQNELVRQYHRNVGKHLCKDWAF